MIKKNRGYLGYFGLFDWWMESFTTEERFYISDLHSRTPTLSIGEGSISIASGDLFKTSQDIVSFLDSLVALFTDKGDIELAEKVIQKAEMVADYSKNLISRHFCYSRCGITYYKARNVDTVYYEKAQYFFQKQIDIHLLVFKAFKKELGVIPSHGGFNQMAIILEKEKRYIDAIQLCITAKNTGWPGDWDKRIIKLEAKIKNGMD